MDQIVYQLSYLTETASEITDVQQWHFSSTNRSRGQLPEDWSGGGANFCINKSFFNHKDIHKKI